MSHASSKVLRVTSGKLTGCSAPSIVAIRSKEVNDNKRELDRIVFFSDAVFAIAITLLALNLKLPENNSHLGSVLLSHYLLTSFPELQSYAISFLAVGFYWVSHHYYFRYIKHYDYFLVWLNIGFLMCIVFLPFPTAVLDDYGGQRLAVIFYAGSMAIAGIMKALLWWYASSNRRLIAQSLPLRRIHSLTYLTLVPPLIFLSSIAIAYFNPSLAELAWLLIPVYFILLKAIDS